MIYLTQLIFINPDFEHDFLEFEKSVIPLMEKYGGRVVYRIRPEAEHCISSESSEKPYEVHFVSFPSEEKFNAFMQDDSRLEFLHLKEKSIKSTILVKGERLV